MPAYDPKSIVITVGPHIVQGFGERMVKIARNADSVSMKVGAQGDVARAIIRDDTGTIELTLLQDSASNDYLSALHTTDRLPVPGASGRGAAPINVKDLRSNTLFFMSEGWIQKPAEPEYGKDVGEYTWILAGKFDTYHVGKSIV